MSYEKALEAAGAKVLGFEQFGSYQGDWWAHVEINGVRGFIHGYFGSCSHCDSFEGEFGWDDEDACNVHRYDHNPECLGCREKKAAYDKKLAEFGKDYLDAVMTAEAAIAQASENIQWDSDAPTMVEWLKKAAEPAPPPNQENPNKESP